MSVGDSSGASHSGRNAAIASGVIAASTIGAATVARNSDLGIAVASRIAGGPIGQGASAVWNSGVVGGARSAIRNTSGYTRLGVGAGVVGLGAGAEALHLHDRNRRRR